MPCFCIRKTKNSLSMIFLVVGIVFSGLKAHKEYYFSGCVYLLYRYFEFHGSKNINTMSRNLLVLIFVIFLSHFPNGDQGASPALQLFRVLKVWLNTNVEEYSRTTYSRDMRRLKQKFQKNPQDVNFPCNLNMTLRSPKHPESVHRLRPGDIDVIGAIGDSLTAGWGVESTTLLGIMHEARGESFSIGGAGTWKTSLTLPNLLKDYNHNIYGYSLNSISTDRKSKFNVAEGGACSSDMPYMAQVLVKRIQKDKNVDLKNHWKMITVFIGHNDFCSANCYTRDYKKILRDHERDILTVLRTLRDNLPNTVVNLLPPLHLNILLKMTDKPDTCILSHLFSCPCLFGLQYRNLREKMIDLMTKWQYLDLKIANYKEFDREDFTVIGHTFPLNFTLPQISGRGTDYGYLAPDCFHASQRGHAKAANDLWNSLFQPYGKKIIDSVPEFTRFVCPTEENPYIYTRKNSN